jgi:hypothetical protein
MSSEVWRDIGRGGDCMQWFTFGGIDFFYRESGQGAPLLLIHGAARTQSRRAARRHAGER